MSTKLIIHKFDSDIQIQTMKITIQDDENSSVSYSDWSESSTQTTVEMPKSSRLVVKLVSGNDPNYFNLDNCAEKVENNEVFQNVSGLYDNSVEESKKWHVENQLQFANTSINNNKMLFSGSDSKQELDNIKYNDINHTHNLDVITQFDIEHVNHSPLEYSLERVKENNARIMENIHMLNRTLNYTKEKELIDNFCTKSMRSFPCSTCGKCFVYETGLKRHCSIRHSFGVMQPRWQVVWTCIECFQVWPCHDMAFKHASLCCKTETDECIKEIKTSVLLQCEFCEKVFTSIPRLLKHSKSHTIANNYECNPCKIGFTSYKSAEQHWNICPFLKICYHFALPKMLLCNACDRKFKNYEQLYNHR